MKNSAYPLYVFLLLVLTTGCGDSPTAPPAMRPIFHLGSDALIAGAGTALENAGITFEFRSLESVAAGDRPRWLSDDARGWLLFVREDQADRARAAWNAWLVAIGAKTTDAEPAAAPKPLPLGEKTALLPERVQAIRDELARRARTDQAVRRNRSRRSEMPAVDADNTKYLRQLVGDVGWIDVERFGRASANAAFLVVQHSGDLPLMMAALPEIERDVRRRDLDGQPYALLYDRLNFLRGEKQRYGTQVVVRSDGEQVVERLEDPDRVDERRRQIGLGPLADYLNGFDGDVRIER